MDKKTEEKKTNSTIALPVLEILRKESDKEHPLLQSQIIHFLKKRLPESSRAQPEDSQGLARLSCGAKI